MPGSSRQTLGEKVIRGHPILAFKRNYESQFSNSGHFPARLSHDDEEIEQDC
jgi:hypothetical protein